MNTLASNAGQHPLRKGACRQIGTGEKCCIYNVHGGLVRLGYSLTAVPAHVRGLCSTLARQCFESVRIARRATEPSFGFVKLPPHSQHHGSGARKTQPEPGGNHA